MSQSLRRYPQYYDVTEAFPYNANSTYHSMQVTATKHLSWGLGFLAAYTWSKTLSHVDDNGPGAYYATIQDYFNRGLEKSVASFNRPHVFKLTWVYDTPIGKGRRWDLGWANYIVGGWQLSGVQQYQSGAALSIGESGISSPDGFSSGIRPDATGQPYALGGAPSNADFFEPVNYLNPAAFSDSPRTGNGVPLRVGTAPRFIDGTRGPHGTEEQFRLSKSLRFAGKVHIPTRHDDDESVQPHESLSGEYDGGRFGLRPTAARRRRPNDPVERPSRMVA